MEQLVRGNMDISCSNKQQVVLTGAVMANINLLEHIIVKE